MPENEASIKFMGETLDENVLTESVLVVILP